MLSTTASEPTNDSTFICDCVGHARSACMGEQFYKEHEGKRYCVLHFPSNDKKQAFDVAVKRKLESKDFNYEGVFFPSGTRFSGLEIEQPVNFSSATFTSAYFFKTVFKAEVSFAEATFNDRASFDHTSFIKKVDFASARFQEEADFNNARFTGPAHFWRCTFTGMAEFRQAEFLHAASFCPAIFESTASFYNARFKVANFRASEFKEKAVFTFCTLGFAEFIGTSFSSDANFFSAKFEGMANFAHAKFETSANLSMSEFNGEARFTSAYFNGQTDFSYAVFKDFASFSGEYGIGGFGRTATCDFRHARFEVPKRVSFHSVLLRPYWFVNLDPRDFQFIDVKWIGNLDRKYIDIEIDELKKREESEEKEAAEKRTEHMESAKQWGDQFTLERLQREETVTSVEASGPSPRWSRFYRLLSIACRQLANNAEENHRYDEASDFRFWSMELRRREGIRARGRLSIGILHALYRHLSGYGEEIGRAFVILLGIWFLFGLLYTRVGFVRTAPLAPAIAAYRTDEVGAPPKLIKSLAYSLEILTLQRPDPQPLTAIARFAVLAERILGPIQAALFALAIRRRFMR